MKFRKKPVIIEAIQWTGHNIDEVNDFIGNPKRDNIERFYDEYIDIVTLEGRMLASINDWVIKGIRGEFYPCKPDIFEATYEIVEEL